MTATRPTEGHSVQNLFTFEIPSSTEWTFQRLGNPFRPNYFVNVKDTVETKIKAMGIYDGESRPFPHPRSSEALRAIAMRWGTVVGCHCAEAFELVRGIRL